MIAYKSLHVLRTPICLKKMHRSRKRKGHPEVRKDTGTQTSLISEEKNKEKHWRTHEVVRTSRYFK